MRSTGWNRKGVASAVVAAGIVVGSAASPPADAFAQTVLPARRHPAGMTQLEYTDPADGGRPLNLMLIYPAAAVGSATALRVPLYASLALYQDAQAVSDGLKRPLVVFSHGAGGNGAGYAWFGEYLASRGYLVALVYHHRANTYDSSALYVRSRLWQRPRDIRLILSHLLQDQAWGPLIDADRIGVAGHSQGGFTALWLGGAEVDPERFLRFQRQWKANPVVPAYLRQQMQPDAEPTRNLRDPRVKAAFAMAPGDLQGFGMDEAGLGRMAIPAYIIVGAGDTTTPPVENAEFAARHIPQAQLDVLPGPVGHEIFGNECDQLGRDNFPESCNDAPGVDRAKLHEQIGSAALTFFDRALGVGRGSPK